ncbi:MAG: hypothetical protein CL706_06630 [Chloroflexi bacterium]|jgi:hypothetical protein|nr:hypothetical protein [Chloroflexota bacterium]|tara:strand:- start:261 stop:506 length:246 start_codon:yes stop_codon:yes gene_type:complete
MLIEKVESASFLNGILRVSTSRLGADGKPIINEPINIPGNLVGEVINGMAIVSKGISEKLIEQGTKVEKKKSTKKKPNKKK